MSRISTNFVSRLWITAVVIGIAFGAGFLLLHRVGSAEIRPLHKPIADLPLKILQFVGEDRPQRDDIEARVNAIDSVSRTYTDPSGAEISVHVAAFTGLGEPTLPHPPTICYPAAGGRIVGQKPVSIGPDDAPIQASLLTIERDNLRSCVLYWYFWDEHVCTTRSQAAITRLQLVGRSEWPPVVKVLLETPIGLQLDDAEKTLTEFAAEVHKWTKSL